MCRKKCSNSFLVVQGEMPVNRSQCHQDAPEAKSAILIFGMGSGLALHGKAFERRARFVSGQISKIVP